MIMITNEWIRKPGAGFERISYWWWSSSRMRLFINTKNEHVVIINEEEEEVSGIIIIMMIWLGGGDQKSVLHFVADDWWSRFTDNEEAQFEMLFTLISDYHVN